MDLRKKGIPFEKKYVQFSPETIAEVATVYHNWQRDGHSETYTDVPEFCKSVSVAEITEKGYSLVPSKYIEFANNDETVDFNTRMTEIQSELASILSEEEASRKAVLEVFKTLGYEIKL